MITADGLVKTFGSRTAVDGISFRVEPGEVLGFLGPNGAGKSTTMRMIAGFLPPTAGRAGVCGFDIGEQPMAAKRQLGYLPEGAPSYGEMTPGDFLDFIAASAACRRRLRPAPGRRGRTGSSWAASCSSPSRPCPRASAAASAWPRRSSTTRRC